MNKKVIRKRSRHYLLSFGLLFKIITREKGGGYIDDISSSQ